MKLIDVKAVHVLTLKLKIMISIQKINILITREYENIKIFLQKTLFLIGLKKILWLKYLKILYHRHNVLEEHHGEGIIGTFYEKELRKTHQKEFRVKDPIKKKGDELYGKWRWYRNLCNNGTNRKNHYIKWVPEWNGHSKSKIKFDLDLSNYATQSEIKTNRFWSIKTC